MKTEPESQIALGWRCCKCNWSNNLSILYSTYLLESLGLAGTIKLMTAWLESLNLRQWLMKSVKVSPIYDHWTSGNAASTFVSVHRQSLRYPLAQTSLLSRSLVSSTVFFLFCFSLQETTSLTLLSLTIPATCRVYLFSFWECSLNLLSSACSLAVFSNLCSNALDAETS